MSTSQRALLATTSRFRYRGYSQNHGMRELAFEDTADQKQTVVFHIDVQSLIDHHIPFQDVPRLCLLLLSGNPLTVAPREKAAVRIALSDSDLAGLLATTETTRGEKKTAKGRR